MHVSVAYSLLKKTFIIIKIIICAKPQMHISITQILQIDQAYLAAPFFSELTTKT